MVIISIGSYWKAEFVLVKEVTLYLQNRVCRVIGKLRNRQLKDYTNEQANCLLTTV